MFKIKKNCTKFLPKIIISEHKKQVFCAMNSARKRTLSWRSYSHCRNKTKKQSFYIMAAISVINVCVCTIKGHHCFLITILYQQFLLFIYSWDFIIALPLQTEWWGTDTISIVWEGNSFFY